MAILYLAMECRKGRVGIDLGSSNQSLTGQAPTARRDEDAIYQHLDNLWLDVKLSFLDSYT
jgi:hypothetical protein